MSSFLVVISPTHAKPKKRIEPTLVVMQPFSAKSVVTFEDVPVTKTARRTLRIINTCEMDIEVKVTNAIRPEYNITIDWTEKIVPAQSDAEMEMVWTPQFEIACSLSLGFIDNRNFSKNVLIILKSKSNNPCKTVKKFPTVGSKVGKSANKPLRMKSPKNAPTKPLFGASAPTRKHLSKTENPATGRAPKPWKNVATVSPMSRTTTVTTLKPTVANFNFRNASPLRERTVPIFNISNATPLRERNSFASNVPRPDPFVFSPPDAENIDPETPENMRSMLDKIKFTPVTETISKNQRQVDDLASLPTPVTSNYPELLAPPKSQLKPRCLMAQEFAAEGLQMQSAVGMKQHAELGNDRTFEMGAAMFDVSAIDPIDEGRLSVGVPVNRTTTISTPFARALCAIEEEEFAGSGNELNIRQLQATFVKTSTDELNLKRDIRLVGTPLTKHAKSMKDLSMKTKVAIQGSMPNLNQMEQISSIEQNRYYHQSGSSGSLAADQDDSFRAVDRPQRQLMDDSHLQADFMFDHKEILAQSSRFNLNELDANPNVPMNHNKASQVWEIPSTPVGDKEEQRRHTVAVGQKRKPICSIEVPNKQPKAIVANKTDVGFLSPPKRVRIEQDSSYQQSFSNISQPYNKLSHTLSLVRKPITPRKAASAAPAEESISNLSTTPRKQKYGQNRVRLYEPDSFIQFCINPDPFAATTICDPFIASSMYLDANAVEKHLSDFKKWLNALVSIPADFNTDCNEKIDVAKLFNEVRKKELILASTKEEQSMNYLTQSRFESLRTAAVQLYMSDPLRNVLTKVAVYVNKNSISVRKDRNLHLDVVMQRYILELLLCFNPLWLRIGLEVVFGEKIPLHSNNDIVGLSTFILNRLFRDKLLEQKHSKAYTLSDGYACQIKQSMLLKFLCLLLFLDKAKQRALIKHNPCLFVKKSPHKETKEILLKFSSELLGNVGDITRELKRLGYILEHKQTYLDEFDYAFDNIAKDLRDGVRLTRVMEIILLRDDLTKQLRVPAISRLQRIHNVNLALRALADADFQLKGDIVAADIVDGYREKTLSLLWQIIYKFRAPKFNAAATVLQRWWRGKSLLVVINRRIHEKEQQRRELAATRIQAAWRSYTTRKQVAILKAQRTEAVIVLQKYTRGFLVRYEIHRWTVAAVCIQRWYRRKQETRDIRAKYLLLRESAIVLQRVFRCRMFANKLLQTAARLKLQYAQKREAAACCIQTYWRAYCLKKQVREKYLIERNAILTIQQRYRAKRAMQVQRQEYLAKRNSAIVIQRRVRATKCMRQERAVYEKMRACVISMQRRRRATLEMRKVQKNYLHERHVVIQLQRRIRATQAMKKQRAYYRKLQHSVCIVQTRYRSNLAMKEQRARYLKIRQSAINVQQKWRALRDMRIMRVEYLKLHYSVTFVQQTFRGKRLMRVERAAFLKLKSAAITIQRRYRAKLQMRVERASFLATRTAVINMQRRCRANKAMRLAAARYKGIRAAVSCLQMHLRGYLVMKRQRAAFLQQKSAAVRLQRWYRSVLKMRAEQNAFLQLRESCIAIQRKWRATLLARKQRKSYLEARGRIIYVQQKWRATLRMRVQRADFQHQVVAATIIQRRWRAQLEMRKIRNQYLLIRTLIICMQRKFRAHQAMLVERCEFLQLKSAAILVQQKYRGRIKMRGERAQFLLLQRTTLSFQCQARGYLARKRFQALLTPEMVDNYRRRRAAITIQSFWRGYCVRKNNSSKRIKQVRGNMKALSHPSVAKHSIRSKVADSVRILRGRFCAPEALHTLQLLERLSRMVPHLLIADADFISAFCYGIMAQAIRSEVDKQLIEHCCRIILNLARYDVSKTSTNTFKQHGLTTIAQILLRWCDKDCDIFNTLCTLIWLYAHCPEKRQVIRNFMTTPEAIYVVRETKKLVARKEKMKQNVRKPIQPARGVSFSSRALPCYGPDYGLPSTKPYIFQSSVFAFDTMLAKLEIFLVCNYHPCSFRCS